MGNNVKKRENVAIEKQTAKKRMKLTERVFVEEKERK